MAGKTKMKCHYEVLGVERDAGADDLKKSYRKLALKWHPDKNPDNVEECTSQFRLVQQAYDVLSDPQERAWYDKHREAILKGGLGHGDNYEDDSMDVFQYFNSSCYSGFNDDENGFYCVYQDVFTKLSEEDYHFMDDRESECDFPEFGNSKSSYEEVVKPFYDFWESYQTAKSYVWVEKYDTREAPDRRCRRLMEAENKKLRDAAKKERNEQIRALVKFIKKRDKRVQAYKKLLEERNEEIKKKAKENRERQIQERLKKMENYKETDWSAMTELEDDLQKLEKSLSHQFGETHPEDEAGEGGDQDGEEDEEEEEYYDDFFCVACNKAFKSDKAFSNHERSKKHKENLAFLRQQMHEEDGELADMLDGLDLGGGPDTEPKEEEEDTKQKLSKKQKKKRKQQKRATIDDEDDEDDDELSKAANGFVCEEETAPPTPDTRKEKEKKKWKKKGNEAKDKNTKTEATETNESLSTVGNGTTDNIDTEADIAGATSSNADVDGEPEQETVENGEQQSEDIAASHNSQSDNSSGTSRHEKPAQIFKCNVCSSVFPTRNKMFDHIKKEGHAIRLDAPPQETTKRDRKNKRKGKR